VATVTVVTAERTLEIEATSIVDGAIDASGHLILTRHDGMPIDMGAVSGMQTYDGVGYSKVDAFSYIGSIDPGAVPDSSVWYDTNDVAGPISSDTKKGLVELATSAETTAGTDNTRAVTPAGLAAVPGHKVQILTENSITETAAPAAYPNGISLMALTTGSGWSVNNGFGSVMTINTETDRAVQIAYSNPGGTGTPRSWFRQYHSTNNGGGWTTWSMYDSTYSLTPGSFSQSTGLSSYPNGWSRLYCTTITSSGWDFAGKAGEVRTYTDGTDFGWQEWTKHTGGTTAGVETERWVRSANSASGWTRWRKLARDAALPDPLIATTTGAATIDSTVWADHPNNLSKTLYLPYDAIVSVELHAWLQISYVDAPSTVRVGVGHDGNDPQDSFETSSVWGNVLYDTTHGANVPGGGQHSASFTTRLAAGTHSFKVRAYKTGTGAATVSYAQMRITPIRWAE